MLVFTVCECVVGLICTIVGVYASLFKRNKESGEHFGNCFVTERIRYRKVMGK